MFKVGGIVKSKATIKAYNNDGQLMATRSSETWFKITERMMDLYRAAGNDLERFLIALAKAQERKKSRNPLLKIVLFLGQRFHWILWFADIFTDNGEYFCVDEMDGAAAFYIGQGTGNTAPAKGDTDLDTAATESRVSATRTQPSADVLQSVATITADGTKGLQECGVFSAAGSGSPPSGGTLYSRHTFTVINVVSGNQVEYTIQWTVA